MSSENKIALHTSYWPNSANYASVRDTEDRLFYLNNLIYNANQYPYPTDIFIHQCNKFDSVESRLISYTNGSINLTSHDLVNRNLPGGWSNLPFMSRRALYKQRYDYDFYMYLESDISFTKKNLKYWLNNKDACIEKNCELGLVRTEEKQEQLYWVDCYRGKLNEYLSHIEINNEPYLQLARGNNFGGWIYDRKEFNKWTKEDHFHLENYIDKFVSPKRRGGFLIEDAANGYGNLEIFNRYDRCIIPIKRGHVEEGCLTKHLPNSFVKHSRRFAYYKIKDVFPPLQRYHALDY